jgi:hypoxanthine phosphoribosyltransferase
MREYRLKPRFTEEELRDRVTELASRINRDYEARELLVIGILKGAFVFLADLVRGLTMPLQIDFVRLASYGTGSSTSGAIRMTKELELPLEGRDVLVVEDIVDTGITVRWFLDYLRKGNPRSVRLCALIDKLERREVEVPIDYVGMTVERGFLVGYGLDFAELHRNLPAIHEVEFTS